MRKFSFILTLACWIPLIQAAPTLNQFQTHFPLTVSGQSAYYALQLTAPAYQASQRNNCADMRVFNSTGEILPYAISTPAPAAKQMQRQPVPWFALPAQTPRTKPQTSGIVIDGDGRLRTESNDQSLPQRGGDIVDLSQLTNGANALLITIQDSSYRGEVNISVSDDLQNWQDIGRGQLLKLNYEGQQLKQERIDLNGVRSRYVMLQWQWVPPSITGINAETDVTTRTTIPSTRQWTQASIRSADAQKGEYLFESGACYAVDRLRIRLPQPNTVARATLYSRASQQDNWQPVLHTTLYRLHDTHGDQENPPFELPPSQHRHWRLQVDTNGGGLGQGKLQAAFGWQPATLIFVARGSAPFTLAVGNNQTDTAAVDRQSLLLGREQAIAEAKLGTATKNVTTPTAQPVNYRPYILWGTLILAVALLGFMAWRLARPASNDTNREP